MEPRKKFEKKGMELIFHLLHRRLRSLKIRRESRGTFTVAPVFGSSRIEAMERGGGIF